MLIIFDWDGTLCDSTGNIVAAMRSAAAELDGEQPTEAAVRDVIGLGLPEAMAQLFPRREAAFRERMQLRYREHYLELERNPSALYPGARETLAELRGRGHYLAVATGKGRRGLDRVLNGHGMGDYFDASRCADETRSKPDPLMLHELLTEMDTSSAEAVVVGDSEYDLAMAAAARVAGVGVSYGVHSAERLRVHDPVAVVDSLLELLQLELLGS